MSRASCSTRFESRPARTSDAGLHVDSARTVTSSPELTRRTGAMFAAYPPQTTVLGVGISVCVFPVGGAGHAALALIGAVAPGAGLLTEDGVRHAGANTPNVIAARNSMRVVMGLLLRQRRSFSRS